MEKVERNRAVDWREVRGVKFDTEGDISIRRAAQDFSDLTETYGCTEPEELRMFIGQNELEIGHRLFLIENLPVEDLGAFLLAEDDERLIAVAKARVEDENGRGQSSLIILP